METALNNLITECVGIDTHKDIHVACHTRIDGTVLQSFSFTNEPEVIESTIRDLQTVPIILEDSNGNGKFVKEELIKLGFQVFHYPSKFTKKNKASKIKSDLEDARQIAMNFMRDRNKAIQLSLFNNYYINLKKMIRRRTLNIKAITSIKNQLHSDLRDLLGYDYKKQIGYTQTFCKSGLNKCLAILESISDIQADLVRVKIKRIINYEEENEIFLKCLKIDKTGELKALQKIEQVGLICASNLLAQIGDIKRFPKESSLARYAGVAPVEFFSSGIVKHRLDTENNRILHSETFDIAIRQGIAEGKILTKHERRKKQRYIIRKIYIILRNVNLLALPP